MALNCKQLEHPQSFSAFASASAYLIDEEYVAPIGSTRKIIDGQHRSNNALEQFASPSPSVVFVQISDIDRRDYVASGWMQWEVTPEVRQRLRELRRLAKEEGIIWQAKAEEQLKEFLSLLGRYARPAIAVGDNGDLRLLWHAPDGQQVGVRFKGQDQVEAVLFTRNFDAIEREAIRVTPLEARLRILQLGLMPIIQAR